MTLNTEQKHKFLEFAYLLAYNESTEDWKFENNFVVCPDVYTEEKPIDDLEVVTYYIQYWNQHRDTDIDPYIPKGKYIVSRAETSLSSFGYIIEWKKNGKQELYEFLKDKVCGKTAAVHPDFLEC